MKCTRHLKYALIWGLSLFIGSCAKDEAIVHAVEQSEEISKPQGDFISLDIQGGLETEQGRAFALDIQQQLPQLLLESREYDITLYLKKLGGKSVSTVATKAQCSIDSKTQKRHIKISVKGFQLQGQGETFNKGDDDWYVCGVIGEAPASILEQNPLSTPNTERKLPLGFPWTKLTISSQGFGEHRAISFNLIGTLLRVGLRNNIVEPVEVIKLKLNSQDFAFAGTFDPTAVRDSDLSEGKYMAFKSITTNQDYEFHVSEDAKRGTGIRLLSGHEQMLSNGLAFVWGYPLNAHANIQAQMEVVTRPKGYTAEEFNNDSSLPSSEKKVFQRYSVPSTLQAPQGGYQHSKVHKAPFMVTSDLMITEVYLHTARVYCTGIIELHNPTLDPIELKHYGLMKVGEDLIGGRGTDLVAFFPQNDQTTQERNVNTADRSGEYKHARLTQALIMPLDMVTGEQADAHWAYWRWRTYEPFQKDGTDPNKTRYFSHSLKLRKVRTGVVTKSDGMQDGDLPMPGTNPTLEPGKTMLILGPTYVEHTPDRDGYGLMYPAGATGAGAQQQLGPGTQAIEAVRYGYCQWAFAMADYSAQNSNSTNDASSTNHLENDHGVVLVKQRIAPGSLISNGSQRKIIDASLPWNNAGSSLRELRDAARKDGGAYFRTRYDGYYFPDPNFHLDQWHIESMGWSNTTGAKWASRDYYTARATLGTRRFIVSGSKAAQRSWPTDRYTAPTKRW